MNLKIYNTLTRKKEAFIPIKPDEIKLYVCGITPYDYAHLGHGRVYVIFDLLYRLLKFMGKQVKYVRNFTDIDDKLIKKAVEQFNDESRYQEIANQFIAAYLEDMAQLNCLNPDEQPKVTENIPEIIDFIQGLIDKGNAYIANGDVYYAVRSFSDYGKLSKRDIDDLQSVERVQLNELKEDPLDFALWKSTKEGTFWQAPWGWGRPGWHIECSALARKFLGDHIDIHAGGMDLIFPHHENEIAQSEGLLGPNFANYWMHNAFIQINKEKMSKSLGNFFTLRQIFEQYDPMVIRFYLLSQKYDNPLEFTFKDLQDAKKTYRRLCNVFAEVDCDHYGFSKLPVMGVRSSREAKTDSGTKDLIEYPLIQKLLEPLLDDLNTPKMLSVLHDNISLLQESPEELCAVKEFMTVVLGLPLELIPEEKVAITPEIAKLIKERENARTQKDWARADAIRDELAALGFDDKDTKIS